MTVSETVRLLESENDSENMIVDDTDALPSVLDISELGDDVTDGEALVVGLLDNSSVGDLDKESTLFVTESEFVGEGVIEVLRLGDSVVDALAGLALCDGEGVRNVTDTPAVNEGVSPDTVDDVERDDEESCVELHVSEALCVGVMVREDDNVSEAKYDVVGVATGVCDGVGITEALGDKVSDRRGDVCDRLRVTEALKVTCDVIVTDDVLVSVRVFEKVSVSHNVTVGLGRSLLDDIECVGEALWVGDASEVGLGVRVALHDGSEDDESVVEGELVSVGVAVGDGVLLGVRDALGEMLRDRLRSDDTVVVSDLVELPTC